MKKSAIKQCEDCGHAKNGEPLYSYNGDTLCAYCIASRMVEANIGVESNGWVGDYNTPSNDSIAQILVTRREMLNMAMRSRYEVNYYAVSNEKILVDGGSNEFDDYVEIEVDGQAVYVIDDYFSIELVQSGQNLTSYDIYSSLPYRNKRNYKQISFAELKQIAYERAGKIMAYIHALQEEELILGEKVHSYSYLLNLACQEIDNYVKKNYIQ